MVLCVLCYGVLTISCMPVSSPTTPPPPPPNTARFTAGGNQLSGALPEELAALENLEVLWLFKNQFSGPLLEAWAPSLLVLDVFENQLTGPIPGNAFGNLANLQQLILGGNRFTGPIPNAVEALAQLTVLNMEDNALTGGLPSALSSLGSLTILRLGNNPQLNANSDLPDFIFEDLVELEELRLPGLQMTGDLNEKDWAQLPNLRVVDLSNNNLESFPANITVCADLEELNLSDNPGLGGNLPDNIDGLTNLKQLFVRHAGLMGNLTESVGNLESLGTSGPCHVVKMLYFACCYIISMVELKDGNRCNTCFVSHLTISSAFLSPFHLQTFFFTQNFWISPTIPCWEICQNLMV